MIGEAALWSMVGCGAAIVAALAMLAEHRRFRRRNPDAIGCVPWLAVFLVALLTACVSLGLAARAWVGGS